MPRESSIFRWMREVFVSHNKPHQPHQHQCGCQEIQLLREILAQGERIMSVTQDVLARVRAEATTLDSIKALVDGFVKSGDLSPENAAAFNEALDVNASKAADIEAALQPSPIPPATG